MEMIFTWTKIHISNKKFSILCLNLVFAYSDCVPTTRPVNYRWLIGWAMFKETATSNYSE